MNDSISRQFRERAGLPPRGKDGKVKTEKKAEPEKKTEKKEPAKKPASKKKD